MYIYSIYKKQSQNRWSTKSRLGPDFARYESFSTRSLPQPSYIETFESTYVEIFTVKEKFVSDPILVI